MSSVIHELFPPSQCSRCGADSVGGRPCSSCAEVIEQQRVADEERIARTMRMQTFVRTVPKSFAWASYEAFEHPETLESGLAERVAQLPKPAFLRVRNTPSSAPTMLLHGGAGRGKTSMAVARARALAEESAYVRFTTAAEIAEAARSTPRGSIDVFARACRHAEVLIVDELGGEPMHAAQPILEVLHHRHAHDRITIITTGLTPVQLRNRYHDGAVRRLVEAGRAVVVNFDPE